MYCTSSSHVAGEGMIRAKTYPGVKSSQLCADVFDVFNKNNKEGINGSKTTVIT